MTLSGGEFIDGRGKVRDLYGREQLVAVEKHQVPTSTDVQRGYERADSDGREQVVLLSGATGENLLSVESDVAARALRANLPVNVKDPPYNAVGDGVANDTAAFVAALAAGAHVVVPAGTYLVDPDQLVLSKAGGRLIGAGANSDGSIIKARLVGSRLLRLSGQRGFVDGILFNGDSKADIGLCVHNFARGKIGQVYVTACLTHGIFFDTAAAAPAGNNNSSVLSKTIATSNSGIGIGCAPDQADNNAITFMSVTATINGSHGILWKGLGLTMFGGHTESNTGYGVQIGESADAITVTDAQLYWPWVENNTAGGVKYGKSSRCVYYRIGAGTQGVDWTNSNAANVERVVVNPTGLGAERLISGTDGRHIEISHDYIALGSGTDTDRNLWLTPKGAGRVAVGARSSATPGIQSGTGSPEGVIAAPVGSVFMRSDGGPSRSLYGKQTGTGTTGWKPARLASAPQAINTDAAFTLTVGTDSECIRHTGTLTANRLVTLSTTGAQAGDLWKITRTGGGAFNLDIGGLKNLVTNQWCEVIYDGAAWVLFQFGSL